MDKGAAARIQTAADKHESGQDSQDDED